MAAEEKKDEPFPFKLNWGPRPQQAGEPLLRIHHPAGVGLLPNHVDLREHCSSIKNQGPTGACTAFAGVAALEYNRKVDGHLSADPFFSARFLYYVERVNIDGTPPWNDAGSYNNSCAKACLQYGVCSYASMPWNTHLRETPSASTYEEAKRYRAATVARLDDEQDHNVLLLDIRTSLSQQIPMIGGFMAFEGIYSPSCQATGVVPLPDGLIVGGHAVFFVGYDDVKKQLLFKNSWGTTWGDRGYGYLPYEYVTKGHASDFWVLSSHSVTGMFGLCTSRGGTKQVGCDEPSPWHWSPAPLPTPAADDDTSRMDAVVNEMKGMKTRCLIC